MQRILQGEEDDKIEQDELLQKGKSYFESCMNVDKIVDEGIAPIIPLAQELLAKYTETSPIEMLGWLHSKAIFSFFRGKTSFLTTSELWQG